MHPAMSGPHAAGAGPRRRRRPRRPRGAALPRRPPGDRGRARPGGGARWPAPTRSCAALNGGALDDPRVAGGARRRVRLAADRRRALRRGGRRPARPGRDGHRQALHRRVLRADRSVLAEGGRLVVQSGSPYFAPRSYWSIEASVREAGFATVPYHVDVPSFGDWGFLLAAAGHRPAGAGIAGRRLRCASSTRACCRRRRPSPPTGAAWTCRPPPCSGPTCWSTPARSGAATEVPPVARDRSLSRRGQCPVPTCRDSLDPGGRCDRDLGKENHCSIPSTPARTSLGVVTISTNCCGCSAHPAHRPHHHALHSSAPSRRR